MKRQVVVAILCALTIAMTGCGKSDSETSTVERAQVQNDAESSVLVEAKVSNTIKVEQETETQETQETNNVATETTVAVEDVVNVEPLSKEDYLASIEVRTVGDSIMAGYATGGYAITECLRDTYGCEASNYAKSGAVLTRRSFDPVIENEKSLCILYQFETNYYKKSSTSGKEVVYVIDGGYNDLNSLKQDEQFYNNQTGIQSMNGAIPEFNGTYNAGGSDETDITTAQRELLKEISETTPGATVIYFLPTVVESGWAWNVNATLAEYYNDQIALINAAAQKYGLHVTVIDGAASQRGNSADNLHPNSIGYAYMSEDAATAIYNTYLNNF